VKWTLLAAIRDGSDGTATGSRYTVPVNHSLGPALVSRELRVICMSALLRLLGVIPGPLAGRSRRSGVDEAARIRASVGST
jgi:hypothetical protein